jgi:uncharacterized membrane protein SirB2
MPDRTELRWCSVIVVNSGVASMYEGIKHSHALLAIISVVWFAGRGGLFLSTGRPPEAGFQRIGPHVVDTLLLLSGLALLAIGGWGLLQLGWLQFKLALLVAYIGLGIALFRAQVGQGLRVGLYTAALFAFAWMLSVAFFKHPLGPFSG